MSHDQPKRQKHHYLPVFYLKNWAESDGRLCEFSRPYKEVKARMTHPDGTGYARGLNTIDDLPPAFVDIIENTLFQRTDDLAARALRQMLSGNMDLSADTKSAWSRFLISLMHRTPEGIARNMDRVANGYRDYWNDMANNYAHERSPSDPLSFEEFWSRRSTTLIARARVHLLEDILDSQLVGQALNNMEWAIVYLIKSRHLLLTSDRPIVMTNGLKYDNSHILIPVTPKHIFVATNTTKTANEIRHIAAGGRMAERVNDFVAKQARKYVYGTSDKQLLFVANRLGTKAKSTPVD